MSTTSDEKVAKAGANDNEGATTSASKEELQEQVAELQLELDKMVFFKESLLDGCLSAMAFLAKGCSDETCPMLFKDFANYATRCWENSKKDVHDHASWTKKELKEKIGGMIQMVFDTAKEKVREEQRAEVEAADNRTAAATASACNQVREKNARIQMLEELLASKDEEIAAFEQSYRKLQDECLVQIAQNERKDKIITELQESNRKLQDELAAAKDKLCLICDQHSKVKLYCGHSFCRRCLLRDSRHNRECTSCQAPFCWDLNRTAIVEGEDVCYWCTKTGPSLKICDGCHKATYCSDECFKASWTIHKRTCKEEDGAGAGEE